MPKTRVLIVDDHALVREGITAFLKMCDDIVAGEASTDSKPLEK
jgi:DNA-binding NarL/FixJ family response regulator